MEKMEHAESEKKMLTHPSTYKKRVGSLPLQSHHGGCSPDWHGGCSVYTAAGCPVLPV